METIFRADIFELFILKQEILGISLRYFHLLPASYYSVLEKSQNNETASEPCLHKDCDAIFKKLVKMSEFSI